MQRNADRIVRLSAFVVALLVLPCAARAQNEVPTAQAPIDTTLRAGEADAQIPAKRGLAKYNSFDLGFTTFRVGYGFLVDFATYAQDDAADQQVVAEPDVGLRDFRLLFKGKLNTKRDITWSAGIMWDVGDDDWHARQTGFMIGAPEINSHFFIGRTKEGYSQYKQMTGYDLWTFERSPFSDAFIPILGDGVKWFGRTNNHRLLWQLGWFNDFLSEREKFATWDNQLVARVTALPVLTEETVLHVAVMARDAEPDESAFRARSRPEAYLAPYFLDTGSFAASHGQTFGIESYYRSGPVLVGGEVGWQTFDAPLSGDPTFHGGNINVDWFVTGETRSYNDVGGYFNAVSPKRTIFEGGPGALETSLNFSYADFDDGALQGGKYWRISPAVKWHLMDYLRIELAYGYGKLDRFDLEGTTQFFQGRILTAL